MHLKDVSCRELNLMVSPFRGAKAISFTLVGWRKLSDKTESRRVQSEVYERRKNTFSFVPKPSYRMDR